MVDDFGQALRFDNLSKSNIRSSGDVNVKISREKFLSREGVHQYFGVKANYNPGDDLNLTLESEFYERDYFPFILEANSENNMNMVFQTHVRRCVPGELFIPGDSSCHLCREGEFSIADPLKLDLSNQKCAPCPENAVCPGGNQIIPNKGFWRAHENSTLLIACTASESCLGNSLDLLTYTKEESNNKFLN